jgi:hypothetical protein
MQTPTPCGRRRCRSGTTWRSGRASTCCGAIRPARRGFARRATELPPLRTDRHRWWAAPTSPRL